ncbi:hypothetical protein YC2023_075494 [Brassica napus]
MLFWFQGTDASQVNVALDIAASFASMKLKHCTGIRGKTLFSRELHLCKEQFQSRDIRKIRNHLYYMFHDFTTRRLNVQELLECLLPRYASNAVSHLYLSRSTSNAPPGQPIPNKNNGSPRSNGNNNLYHEPILDPQLQLPNLSTIRFNY